MDQKRRNFDYYDPLTTGDSSLSACVQSILAAEIGYEEKSLEYFQYALLMDLADVAGNVVDGAHVASTGGVWMALTYGFGGMRDYNGALSFDPRLPRPWRQLRFTLRFQRRRLEVELSHERMVFRISEGEPLTFRVRDREVTAAVDAPVVIDSGANTSAPDAVTAFVHEDERRAADVSGGFEHLSDWVSRPDGELEDIAD